MMYSFAVCCAVQFIRKLNYPMVMWHQTVTNDVSGSLIKRFKHENYVPMYNNIAQTNEVHRFIGSTLPSTSDCFYLIICYCTLNLFLIKCTHLINKFAYFASTTTSGICLLTCLIVHKSSLPQVRLLRVGG